MIEGYERRYNYVIDWEDNDFQDKLKEVNELK